MLQAGNHGTPGTLKEIFFWLCGCKKIKIKATKVTKIPMIKIIKAHHVCFVKASLVAKAKIAENVMIPTAKKQFNLKQLQYSLIPRTIKQFIS